MPSTSAKIRRQYSIQGFTLVELMTAALISLIVFAALFSAYIYIARNITRISLAHQQSLQSSRVLHLFANDVGTASKIISASNGNLILQFPDASQVTYAYDYPSRTLTRTAGGAVITLGGITPLPLAFSTPAYSSNVFNYYNQAGLPLLPIPGVYPPDPSNVLIAIDVRQIELSYLISGGDTNTGTMASNAIVSSRMALRNKMPLGQ